MTEPILNIQGLKAYYRSQRGTVRAVDGVDLAVQPGEIFGIAGESGCGKSTLARAILRLLKPPSYIAGGSIFFNGRDLLRLDEEGMRRLRGSALSYIPQSSMNALNPVLRVRDQIIDAITTHQNITAEEARRRVERLLAVVGLPSRVNHM